MSYIITLSSSYQHTQYIQEIEKKLGLGYEYLKRLNKRYGLVFIVGDKCLFDQLEQKVSYHKDTNPFIYVNVDIKENRNVYSFNIYAHELGHAIWDLCHLSNDFKTLVLFRMFFLILCKKRYVDDLVNIEDFFAEIFAMYVENQLLKDIQYHTPISRFVNGHTYLFNSLSYLYLDQSPHDILSAYAIQLNHYFETLLENLDEI